MKVGIIGSGAFGITLSRYLTILNRADVIMWDRKEERVSFLKRYRVDDERLPNIDIPIEVEITNDIEEVAKCSLVLVAVPSQAVREVVGRLKKVGRPTEIVSVVKGIEVKSGKRMSEIIREAFEEAKIAVMSGPTIAMELAMFKPTSIVVASDNIKFAGKVQKLFHSRYLRVYTSSDVVGVELGGALKNIVAIAAGAVDGLGLGDNAKGALLTRGLAEMMRFGVRMGANPLTFSGLSGIGDLITTSYSKYSRNRYVGEQLGKGMKLDDILKGMVMVAEGVKTTEAVYKIAKKKNISMPLTQVMWELLKGKITPDEAINKLMTRPPKPEIYF